MTSPAPKRYDVAIIGFGPTGAVLAGLLGQAGLEVLAVERAPTVYEKPRAIAIDHEILRLLQNLGVADEILPYVAPFPASHHFGVEGQLIRRITMAPEPYAQGYTPTMVFTQPPVEAALRAHVASYPTVDIALGEHFISLEQDAESVTIQLETRIVQAKYLVGADGASSQVRKQLGIPWQDLVFDEPWLVIDVRVNPHGLAKLPTAAAQFCEPARPSTYIIGPGNHRRWEIMLLPHEDPRAMEQPQAVWQLLSRWLTPADGDLWRASSYRFHALVAQQWRQGRVLLAGDAAHQQPPFLGQGMCQGIRDAANLAWKLSAVLQNGAPETLLDTYAQERAQHVRTLTSRIKSIGHAICERDPAAAAARDARLLTEGGGHPPTITRQEIVPGLETGLLSPIPHPANGTLFPQPWLQTPNGPVHMDILAGTGWRLIQDARAPALPGAGPRRITIGQPGSNDPLIERDAILATWFDQNACTAAIIRPDHYVYGVLTRATAAAVLAGWQQSVPWCLRETV